MRYFVWFPNVRAPLETRLGAVPVRNCSVPFWLFTTLYVHAFLYIKELAHTYIVSPRLTENKESGKGIACSTPTSFQCPRWDKRKTTVARQRSVEKLNYDLRRWRWRLGSCSDDTSWDSTWGSNHLCALYPGGQMQRKKERKQQKQIYFVFSHVPPSVLFLFVWLFFLLPSGLAIFRRNILFIYTLACFFCFLKSLRF